MDYNAMGAAGQQNPKEAAPILRALSELEHTVTGLEERSSELQARLEPVLQSPSLKIAGPATTERPGAIEGRVPTPASPILSGLHQLRGRVENITARVQLLMKNLDV